MFEEKETDREMFNRSSRLRGHPSLQPVKKIEQNLNKKNFINLTCCAVPLVRRLRYGTAANSMHTDL